MRLQPTKPKARKAKSNHSYKLKALASVLMLTSCSGSNKVATECFELQEAINANQPSFSTGTIDKAAETAKAQAEKDFENALVAVQLSDTELKEKRDRLVTLARESHTFSLQAADVMTEDGYLSGTAADDYRDITTKRMATSEQLFAEQNGLQIHCSLQ